MISNQEWIARRVFAMFDTFQITDKIARISVAKRILQKIEEDES